MSAAERTSLATAPRTQRRGRWTDLAAAFARARSDLLVATAIFLANLLLQNYLIGRQLYTFTDSGVHLYSAHLLGSGFVPYRDFFLSHPPYEMYVLASVLKATGYNFTAFQLFYTGFVFSSLFAIYFTILGLGRDRFAAIVGVFLFSTFAEFAQWDAHYFALAAGRLLRVRGLQRARGGVFRGQPHPSRIPLAPAPSRSGGEGGSRCGRWLLVVVPSLAILLLIPGAWNDLVEFQLRRPAVG